MAKKTEKDPADELESTSIDEKLKPIKSLLDFIQTALSLLLGLATLILVTGFIIVNVYLSQVTELYGFNITSGQYISAGFPFLMICAVIVTVIWPTISRFLSPLKHIDEELISAETRWHALIGELQITRILRDRRKQTVGGTPDQVEQRELDVAQFEQRMAEIAKEIQEPDRIVYEYEKRVERDKRVRQGVVFIAGTALLIAFSIVYSIVLFPNIHRALGGGLKATIILSVRPEYPLSSLGLSNDITNPTNTTTVWLLAELTDGLLVADQNTGRVVAVKNEAIVAVIDDTVAESLIVPSATSTNTPTATPTATFTPVLTETATP